MLVVAVAAVVAPLLAVTASPVSKLEIGGILICTEANSTGACEYNVYRMGECHQLEAPYRHHVGTFMPDGEAFFCYPRMVDCGEACLGPTGCTLGAVNFTYPYTSDMGAVGWDKYFRSFDCHEYEKGIPLDD